MTSARDCPCGSGVSYRDCCQRYHRVGATPDVLPATPEAVMRSRYSAYCLSLADYLLASWHPSTRPSALDLGDSPSWTGLRILSASEAGERGRVHFQATCRVDSGWRYLEEESDFVRESGRWYYLAGKTRDGVLKPGRNDPCPCGSGRKFKACGCLVNRTC